MGLKDKELEAELVKRLRKLAKSVGRIGPNDCRHILDSLTVFMCNYLRKFDQERYETDEVYIEDQLAIADIVCDLTYDSVLAAGKCFKNIK